MTMRIFHHFSMLSDTHSSISRNVCWVLPCLSTYSYDIFFLYTPVLFFFFFFFFQAEDGIRDLYVTGVQTCALPILLFVLIGAAISYYLWTSAQHAPPPAPGAEAPMNPFVTIVLVLLFAVVGMGDRKSVV